MLEIVIPGKSLWDEDLERFNTTKETKLHLEHSLVSLRRWESKWHKPFLDKKREKTNEETIDYIRCMTLDKNVDPNVYYNLTKENLADIKAYIKDPMTATTFGSDNSAKRKGRRSMTPTAEVIYYRMIAHQVPVEFQKWHLNQLLTLLKVCDEEAKAQDPHKKKTPRSEIYSRNQALNEARRAKMHSKG